MSVKFQINDPSIESQWRSIILFELNVPVNIFIKQLYNSFNIVLG
jgi:hypothetical protein